MEPLVTYRSVIPLRSVGTSRSSPFFRFKLQRILIGLLPVAMIGCGTIQVAPRYISGDADGVTSGKGSVRIVIADRRSARLLLGTTQDIYKQRIEADIGPEQILHHALEEGLRKAGYSVSDDSKTLLEVDLRDFVVSWAQAFGAQVTASVSIEARVRFGDSVLASEHISQTANADLKLNPSSAQQGGQVLSQALTRVVDLLVDNPRVSEALARPRALQVAEEERAQRELAERTARERQRAETMAQIEAEQARIRTEAEVARVRAEAAAQERIRAERAKAEARSLTDPAEPKRVRAVTPPSPTEAVSVGTCFAVSSDGLIVTALHVVSDAREIKVRLSDGRMVGAKIETRNSPLDTALLRIDEPTPNYLLLARPRSVEIGEEVFTMGFPATDLLGEEPKFTSGTISALSGLQDEPAYLQISVPVQPGNSGGPLVGSNGRVVGMVVGTAATLRFIGVTGFLPQNINWAIKSDYIGPLFDAPPSADVEVPSRRQSIGLTQSALCEVRASKSSTRAP
jgi:S1-C subfamily serine protease